MRYLSLNNIRWVLDQVVMLNNQQASDHLGSELTKHYFPLDRFIHSTIESVHSPISIPVTLVSQITNQGPKPHAFVASLTTAR